MSTPLEALLSAIDPEQIHLENERRADEVLNSFAMPGATVPDWAAFRECVARFLCHAENLMLGLTPPMAVIPDRHFGRACWLLSKTFGVDASAIACNIAISGVEGGLPKILRIIARNLAEDYSVNQTKAMISGYWNRLSLAEKHAACQEYLDKYGRFLPPDVTGGGAARLRAFFPQFLEKHPQLMRSLRQVGRNK